jgi:hypothetical protein
VVTLYDSRPTFTGKAARFSFALQVSKIMQSFMQAIRIQEKNTDSKTRLPDLPQVDKSNEIVIFKAPCSQQISGECGVFALAFYVELYFGFDPMYSNFDIANIRNWWLDCVTSGRLKRCPQVPEGISTIALPEPEFITRPEYKLTFTIPLGCKCRLASFDPATAPKEVVNKLGLKKVKVFLYNEIREVDLLKKRVGCSTCGEPCHPECLKDSCGNTVSCCEDLEFVPIIKGISPFTP